MADRNPGLRHPALKPDPSGRSSRASSAMVATVTGRGGHTERRRQRTLPQFPAKDRAANHPPAPGTGRSELNMSSTAFQDPSAFLRHTVTYLPRSVAGCPLGSVKVSSYVPVE